MTKEEFETLQLDLQQSGNSLKRYLHEAGIGLPPREEEPPHDGGPARPGARGHRPRRRGVRHDKTFMI